MEGQRKLPFSGKGTEGIIRSVGKMFPYMQESIDRAAAAEKYPVSRRRKRIEMEASGRSFRENFHWNTGCGCAASPRFLRIRKWSRPYIRTDWINRICILSRPAVQHLILISRASIMITKRGRYLTVLPEGFSAVGNED